MGAVASQITSLTIVYSTVDSDADQRITSKLRVTGLCVGNSPRTGEFPAQMASNAENVSIWWRHHDFEAGYNYPIALKFDMPIQNDTIIVAPELAVQDFRKPDRKTSCRLLCGGYWEHLIISLSEYSSGSQWLTTSYSLCYCLATKLRVCVCLRMCHRNELSTI